MLKTLKTNKQTRSLLFRQSECWRLKCHEEAIRWWFMSHSLSFPFEKTNKKKNCLCRPACATFWQRGRLSCPIAPCKKRKVKISYQNDQFLSIWSRSNSPPSCKTSLFVLPSPFQRLCLPPPTGPESTLHAESLSSSSYDESSSSSASSSSASASCHDLSPGSGTQVKSESGWPGWPRLGGLRLDWRLSSAENPVQLRLWKFLRFWVEKKAKKDRGVRFL